MLRARPALARRWRACVLPSLVPSLALLRKAAVPSLQAAAAPQRAFASLGSKAGMTPEEKFEFDLNGFLIVRGALSKEEVGALNAGIDAHYQEIRERADPALANTRKGSPLAGDEGAEGRRDLGGMLGWPQPHCEPFRGLLAHPGLLPYLVELVGEGYRMDHLPLVITQHQGSEGFHLHGGPLTESGRFNPTLQYRCVNGAFYNSLLGMSVQLVDHNEGDGGFCVVRGSHKVNFPVPDAFTHGESMQEHLHRPTTKAGDVIFFSEATVHGATPWRGQHERRIALYRFAPPTVAYGRSYWPQWPAEMLEGMSPAQRAVLEPPYATRLDRPLLRPDEEKPVVEGRSARKKEHDRDVFGTQYF